MEQLNKCPICFETINAINNCITPCGHAFCFECIAKTFSSTMGSNNLCPCCRTELINLLPNEQEDHDDDEYDDDDDDDDETITLEDFEMLNEDGADVEIIAERMQSKNYTFVDLLALYIGRSSNRNIKHNDEFFNKMSDDLDDIARDADGEYDMQQIECELFAKEDKNALVV